MSLPVYVAAFSVALSLIVSIGAQNAFVMRQGLRGEHVFAVCLACALSDAVLITLGVTSFQRVAELLPAFEPLMRYGGAAFLIFYAGKSLYAAWRSPGALLSGEDGAVSRRQALFTCLAFTWFNPHVYLDTVALLGSISTQFPGQQLSFALGAMSASTVFFFALGYGAAWLRPLLARPAAWRVLELLIAAIMALTAWRLLSHK